MRMGVIIAVLLGLFLIAQTSVSYSDSSAVNIVLADKDSQFFGNYTKSVINITYNISTRTNITRSLELCADLNCPLLFVINGTILGCGTLKPNSIVNTSMGSAINTTLNGTVNVNGTGNTILNGTANVNGTANTTLNGTANVSPNTTLNNQVNFTTELNSTELVQAYRTEYHSAISLPIFTLANFTTQFSKMDKPLENYSFEPGDGSSQSYADTNETFLHFPHRFLSYGFFRARVRGIGNSSTLLDISSRRVLVNMSLLVSNVDCPDLFVTNKTFSCVLNVIQAMKLDVKVSIGDSTEIIHNFAETPIQVISSENQTSQEVNCTNDDVTSVFTALPMILERKFYVRAIELVSPASGPLRMQVFRAIDQPTESSYEPSGNISCPSFFNQTTNTTVCFQTFATHYSNPMTSPTEVTAVRNLTWTVNAGYNFIILSHDDVFIASPDDVIKLRLPLASNVTFNSSLVANATNWNSSFANATNSTSKCSHQGNRTFQEFSLYGVLPYEVRVFLRFMDPGVLPLGISVHGATQRNLKQIIIVQRAVEDLQIIYTSIVRYNSTRVLGFRLARGTNASCAWALSGNGVDIRGSRNASRGDEGLETSRNQTYDVPGTLTYLVKCSNKVSNISENVSISVRRNISDFNASFCFAAFAYDQSITCWKAAAFGDHVKFTWIIGTDVTKGSEFETILPSPTPQGSQTSANVTAMNVVSQESLVLSFKILKNPLSIHVLPWPISASLSTVTLAAVINWSYPNGTAYYEAYRVNIPEALRSFIHSPTFRIKVDDKTVATSIANATLRNHTFPLAGPTNVKHNVFIEAIGHPEMNLKTQIIIVDRIEGLKIASSCSSDVLLNNSCTFTASYNQGSDVVCVWNLASVSACQFSYTFEKLGNFIFHVNATNAVSSDDAVFNVTVVIPGTVSSSVLPQGSPTVVISPSTNAESLRPSPTRVVPSIRSSTVNPSVNLIINGPRIAAVGQTILFNASLVGANAIFTWAINNTLQPAKNWSISLTFNESGVFQISLNVSNHISEKRTSIFLVVQYRISDLQVHLKHFNKLVTALFSVRTGTDVSYSAHFGDGSPPISGRVRELMTNVSEYHLYKNPGRYNLSISVFNLVGPNLTKRLQVFVNETFVSLKWIVLYGASPELNLSRSFTETDQIVLSVKTITESSQLKFSWKVQRVDSVIPEKISIQLDNIATDKPTLRFSAKQIRVGVYKVFVTVQVSLDGSSVTRWGYFRRIPKNLKVAYSCGSSRTISVDKPLILNVTVSDGSEGLKYTWFCDRQFNVTCFGDTVLRNSSVVRFPANSLHLGESYNFVVQVTDGKISGMVSQRVIVGSAGTTLQLCLRFLQNLKTSILHTQETEIVASCLECNTLSNLTWTWRLIKTTHCNSQPACDINHLINHNSSKLVIPPNILEPDTSYRIEVNVTNSTHIGYATDNLLTNDLPSGGYCSAAPSQGFVLVTAFLFVCNAWYDKQRPLFYEYWYSIDGENYSLFYHGGNPESSLAHFEAGLHNRDYIVNIKTIIRDSLGASTVNNLTVKNLPPSEDKVQSILNSARAVDQKVETLLSNGDIQGAIQFMKVISEMLNERSDVTGQKDERIEIRETILGHMKNICCSNYYSIQQSLQTMVAVSRVVSELNHKAQLYASSVYLNMSEGLNLISSQTALVDDARNLANGLSFVLTASSLPGNNMTPRNNDEVRKINEDCLLAIDKLGDALLVQLKPGDPPIMLVTALVNIALQKHFTVNFPGTRLKVSEHLTEFLVPKTIDEFKGSFVSSKLVSMLINPFSWQSSNAVTSPSGVASLLLMDTQGSEVVVSDLLEPFSMFLHSSDMSPVSMNYSAKLNELSDPDLYKIDTTKANTSLLVTLHHVVTATKGQLRLRLKTDSLSAVLRHDVIVSTASSFPVSLTWSNLNGLGEFNVSVQYESLSFRLAEAPNEVQYTISFQEIGCFYWNDSEDEWESNGCQVGSLSTPQRIHCQCDHLTWFGGSLVVPPNTISLSTIAQRINDPRNYATILGVFCSLCFLYFIAIIWARRRDRQDEEKNRITWCPSNHMTDSCQYQVIVYTGIRRNAGTTANVGLILSGEAGKSRMCLLKDSRKEVLKRGSIDTFLISTTGSLGAVEYIQIWHDNTGSDPAWFVNRVVVLDSQSGQVWNFLCYRWLAVDEGDGQIQRILPIADSEDLVRFRHLFVSRATTELTDAHLWFSIAFRPVFSPFTRVQRVSCCLSLLLTSMMANAMWYQTGGSGGPQIDLVLFSFSWEEIFIGVCSNIIVFPINLLFVQIFRHCRSNPSSSIRPSSRINNLFEKEIKSKDSTFFAIQHMVMWPIASQGVTSLTPPAVSSRRKSSALSYVVSPDVTSDKPTSRRMTSVLPCMTSSSVSTNARFREAMQRNDALLLPHWVTYVAWLGVLVTCLTCAAVTFMYGIEFGESKTRKWLLSLSVSFVNDIFVAQPLKVLAVTIVLAYIIKKPVKEHYVSDETVLHVACESFPRDSREFEPPDPRLCTAEEFLQTARSKRKKDKFMYGLLKTLSSYLFFTLLVLIIAYGQRDPLAYHLTRTQENTFTRPPLVKNFDKAPFPGFHQVANVKDFWLWSEAVFLPGLSNIEWHNYTGRWSAFTGNFGGFLFGAARWRQKRLKKGVCQVLPIFEETIPNCTGNYRWSNEDSLHYFSSWKTPLLNSSCSEGNIPPDHWCFSSSSAFKTYPYVGELETYSGGGYNLDILQDYSIALNRTQNLKNQAWIDEYTRAVFIEIVLYNPNVNLFSVSTLLFEVSAAGNFNPRAEILSIRLYNYVGNFQIFVVICQFLFLGFLVYFTYRSAKLLLRERLGFFRKIWNVYELSVVSLSWLAIIFYFVSFAFRKWIIGEFRKDPTKFISFWYSTTWQMSLEYVIAWLVFLISFKFIRLFQFNRRMFLLPSTLSRIAIELLNYSLVFLIVLLAFTFVYHLILHPYNPNFASVIATMETLVRMLLGKYDVVAQRQNQFPGLERVILFCYICTMKFILLNVFVVIMNEGFSRARAQNDQQRNDFEFFDFWKHTVYNFLGIRRLNVKSEKNSTKRHHVRFTEEVKTLNVEQVLDRLERKVEKLWKLVHSSSFEENFCD